MFFFIHDEKWQSIFEGKVSYKFDNLGLSMTIGRLSRKYRKNKNNLKSCIKEANSFCYRYEPLLKNDLKKLMD